MQLALKEVRIGLRNSTVRIPFRYGNTCLTRCPQAVLFATIEVEGTPVTGYSGDCLPPGWFDKAPGKGFDQQISEMLNSTEHAIEVFSTALAKPRTFFDGWRESYEGQHQWGRAEQLPSLLATFGLSLVERAIMDAMARRAEISFHQAVHQNLFGIKAGEVFSELTGLEPSDWLPAAAKTSIFARHTVGLSDPLTVADIATEDRLQDGAPQALEEYVTQTGTSYFKVKVANDLEGDLQRLEAIASIVEKHRGRDYQVTLDGNEQYRDPSEFDELVDTIRRSSKLRQLWANVLVVEQPLPRSIALDSSYTSGIRALSKSKPVIIDESDGELGAYAQAIECGYRGVSVKSCKGPVKAILNNGVTSRLNQHSGRAQYVMTAEDLCCVGIIPVQADLCLAATLGLDHAERNGHHFHPGLQYLSQQQQEAALEAHSDLYSRQGDRVAPCLRDGRFHIASLQCPGFGFEVKPVWQDYIAASDWSYDSLGLE
jgi:hypothetical protein